MRDKKGPNTDTSIRAISSVTRPCSRGDVCPSPKPFPIQAIPSLPPTVTTKPNHNPNMQTQPNKHYRLILWTLLYRVPVMDLLTPELEDAVDQWACDRCKLDHNTFRSWKMKWRGHYDRMLRKRMLRMKFVRKNGFYYKGRTPADPERADRRQYNVPHYANFLRNESPRFWSKLRSGR